jgi:hypothetical protein
MVIEEAGDDGRFGFLRARSGPSNVAYYALAGQREGWKNYRKRERSILYYVRAEGGAPDYFVFADDVEQDAPRWHAWTWHLWSPVAGPENRGWFIIEGPTTVRADRPNADLWIRFLEPSEVTVEQQGIPAQPSVAYAMDHNGMAMRAVAGPCRASGAPRVIASASRDARFGPERVVDGRPSIPRMGISTTRRGP